MKFTSSLKLKLIYVIRINDAAHRGCLKVGETTCNNDNAFGLAPNSKPLNESARKRINQYTQTAGIKYDLLYTELTIYNSKHGLCSFNDKEVHGVLERSGIRKKVFDTENKANEWFITDLETVKRAITAVKEGRESLTSSEISHDRTPVVFRPEQREAIEKTKKQFKKGNQMLWNAKMRFGKTLSALQVVKDMTFSRTLILTHRPVVDSGWFEDFGKIFYDNPGFAYGSRNNGGSHASLETRARRGGCKYVYFASMQDLRGSELVGGNFDKNDEVFATAWDCIIVDEAHEGTQTELGRAVMQELTKADTKILRLSGTPFNLLDNFKEDEIYTWDYVMEQRAKVSWDSIHFGDPNPYASLPTMNIYTYDLGRLLHEFVDEDVAFNFREFFRVNESGNFIHGKDVKAFLNLVTREDRDSCYPFANEEYRNIFRHTLWMLPGVKEARALSVMLQSHPVFRHFKVVNVAGDGDEDEENKDALAAVEEAIGKDPDATRTITLSCGRLTTGVSVKAWTGVFMLSGSYNTAASSYMQTIFRVQTPATINGRVKEQCYVFDFAPDRTLKVLAETAKISTKAGKQSAGERQQLGEFLNFCPIISVEGSQMKQFDTEQMLQHLKRVYVERVVQNGFEDGYLYNDELMKLSDIDIKKFEKLKAIIGQTKAMAKTNDITINDQGLTNEEYEEKKKLEKKKKRELTEEEKARLAELKEKKKGRDTAVSILRGISIRMPLLIYGADITNEDKQLSIDNFTELVDALSWEEFMPKGVTKEIFNQFKGYYDPDIFTAAAKRIRQMARAADKLSVEERIERITDIFSTFRNPDKETVLTPWRVVNMHLGDCLGGYNFFEKGYDTALSEPRFIDHGEVTANVFAPDSRILEINSKSGLYPLYMAYSVYRTRVKNSLFSVSSIEDEQRIWDKVIAENIFVICKTPMAKAITRRTLLGFRKGKTNMWAPEDLINKIKNQPELFIKKVGDLVGKNVKINAIVGNPPYQENVGTEKDNYAIPLYHLFVEISKKIKPNYISMIMPSRWFSGGRGLDEFRDKMLSDTRIEILHDYPDSTDLFPTVDISAGICYFLWNLSYANDCNIFVHSDNNISWAYRPLKEKGMDSYIRHNEVVLLWRKVRNINSNGWFNKIVSPQTPFGLVSSFRDFKNEEFENSFKFYTFGHIGYVSASIISKNIELAYPHKVYISKAYGERGKYPFFFLGKPFYGEPNSCCSQSYLVVGPFDSKEVSINVIKYMRSKFFRAMVMLKKNAQDNMAYVFSCVPLQDFTYSSDINWSNSVEEIDTQLYAKYNLTDEEITFIESMIKPM